MAMPSTSNNFTGANPLAAAAAAAAAPGSQAGVANPFFPFFTPSFDLALVGSAAFTILTLIHVYLLFKTRAWNFNLIPQAALVLAVGMIARLFVISSPTSVGAFTISSVALMIPGSLIPIQLIFTYTRLMWWITPPHQRNTSTLWLPPRANSFILVFSQTIADVLISLGSGQFIPSPGPRTTAIGAVLEMLVWVAFLILVARFTFISRRWVIDPAKRQPSLELGIVLTVSAALIAIRGIMQVLEKDALQSLLTTQMPSSIVTTEEWPVWVFDFLPQFLVLAITAQYYPGFILPKRLMGFRLNTKGLLKDESDQIEKGGFSSKGIPSWNISRPVLDPSKGQSVQSTQIEAY